MYIFLFIIVGIVLVIHGNKLNKLEALIKKGMKPADAPVSSPASASASASASAVSYASTPSSAPLSASVSTSAPTPAQDKPPQPADISSEEASGRIIGRIGIAAVVIGMAFFLKYAFDNNWVGPSGRVCIGLIIGVVVMALGQKLRAKYLGYSDLLMGGGMVILYLSMYASYGFYHLVDPMMAFLGMIVVTAVGAFISITNATETLSGVALIGGFLTPFFIGTPELGPWVVFTYITILNAGTLAILLYKKWPYLVVISLIGTWIYFGQWYDLSYTSDLLIPTLIFLFTQFLIFNGSSFIRLIGKKIKAIEIDYIVISITAVGFASVVYHMLMPTYEHMVSIIAVLLAGFYGAISLITYKENPEDKSLSIFLPGVAVAFLTCAIPIEFSGPWIAAWMFVEAIVLYIIASTASSRGYQIMGVVVYILGLINVLSYIGTYVRPAGYVVFFNGPFIMLAFATVTAYAISFVYYRYGSVSDEVQKRGIAVFTILANVITLYALTLQIVQYYSMQPTIQVGAVSTTISILWALYAALLIGIGFARRYVPVRRMGMVLFIITAFKVVLDVWSLGELYRIVSFILFGIIALSVSFVYVRYRDRLKDVM